MFALKDNNKREDGLGTGWSLFLQFPWRQVQSQLKSICQICACADAFAALDRRGSMVSWGALPSISLHDVQRLSASSLAFAALKKDGTVTAWGDRPAGACIQLES